jgi:hypothetical protein
MKIRLVRAELLDVDGRTDTDMTKLIAGFRIFPTCLKIGTYSENYSSCCFVLFKKQFVG